MCQFVGVLVLNTTGNFPVGLHITLAGRDGLRATSVIDKNRLHGSNRESLLLKNAARNR
jgi:hypothetical protein